MTSGELLVLDLAVATDIQLAGGKAAALANLIQAGFTVPPGFVVSAAAHNRMTPPLQTHILQHFDALQAEYVAVRSSATNEDGKDAAWAGQLDTFLNINRQTLLGHIQECWQSASSARAVAYAQQKALTSGPVAVIVQAMIQSEVSGVAFSVHPITQDKQQIIIEAGLGLGEAVVSGEITPDTYITSKSNGQILQKHPARQTKKLVQDTNGQTCWVDLDGVGQSQKLTDEQLTQLNNIVARLETFFGYPVDVEWALYQGTFYILQSRPITSLTDKVE